MNKFIIRMLTVCINILADLALILQKHINCNAIGIVVRPDKTYVAFQSDYIIETECKNPNKAVKDIANQLNNHIETNKLLSSISNN